MKVAAFNDKRKLQTYSNGKLFDFDLNSIANDWSCSVGDIEVFEFSGSSSDLPFTKVENNQLVVDENYKKAVLDHQKLVDEQPEEQVRAYQFKTESPELYAVLPQSAKDELDKLAIAPPEFSYEAS